MFYSSCVIVMSGFSISQRRGIGLEQYIYIVFYSSCVILMSGFSISQRRGIGLEQ